MFKNLGQYLIDFYNQFWGMLTLFGQILYLTIKREYRFKNVLVQMSRVGVESMPITLLTAISVGMVFAIHVSSEFSRYGAAKIVGGIVGIAVWRELAPVLTGVVVAGRVGASIAAEIGTMKITEQIDALKAMAVSPISYLVVPRFIALVVMMPILVIFADVLGFLGALVVSVFGAGINVFSFLNSAYQMLAVSDILGGIFKAFIFGIVVAIIACYRGLQTNKGAQGVGNTTTSSVVISISTIFVANYILSSIIFGH